MARNTGKNFRRGPVRKRGQVFNPATGTWTKRDTQTGEFLGQKSDGKRFKGVRKERGK